MAKNLGVELPENEVRDIVEKWRASRPATVRYWKELEKACRCAVEDPSKVWSYRNVKFAKRGRFLALKLPSGRCLWYANPRIEFKDMTWGEKKSVVAFDGVDSKTRKWGIQYLYGGLLAENITQATARDILVAGMLNAEKANYPIVMHVHDEAVAEVPEGFGSVEEFEKLLCQAPAWAEGLPLKAEGWRGRRYRK
jgi:DNA polymerase